MAPMPVADCRQRGGVGGRRKNLCRRRRFRRGHDQCGSGLQSGRQFLDHFHASARRLERLGHGRGQPGPADCDGRHGHQWQRRRRRLAQPAIGRARQRAGVHPVSRHQRRLSSPLILRPSPPPAIRSRFMCSSAAPPAWRWIITAAQITWTPQGLGQIGAIPVTIAATNYAGSTNWTFTITVPNPPPATPTNLYLAQRHRILGDFGVGSRRPGGWFRNL